MHCTAVDWGFSIILGNFKGTKLVIPKQMAI